ncbi:MULTISPECIES: DoxX family protein [Arcobacteraceae]|uniref:DoxX family protein n=1 Tax=Arcobacteraceae TaxID=2808963 RepID=UPI000DEB4BE8|nr:MULTISPECIES: DoxX family protein [Arcobacteraceae]MBL3519264.1 DoxX family protein [Aliarcobacter lanthieri]RBQ26387.1 GntR family transcriptional regulator [Arcobacter sp. CECT 9188]
MRSLESFLARVLGEDIGKLILRLTLGILMLFHGLNKLNGIDGIKSLVVNNGFPEFFAYGVYIGEIIIPILIIVGLYTRISSFIYAMTMLFAIYLAHSTQIFAFNEKTGGLAIELQLLFMFGAIALMFLGAGRISADKR